MTKEQAVTVGKKLRELRGIRTRVGVARALGISASALQAYETGERMPRDPVKERIAAYYETTVGELFFGNR